MDHLPLPSRRLGHPFRVRCLCSLDAYTGLDFQTFPQQNGWRLEPLPYGNKLTRIDNTDPPPKEISAFLQAWLFFGVLVEVFSEVGLDFNTEDFILRQKTEAILTTEALPSYLQRWINVAAHWDKYSRKQHFLKIQEILTIALAFTSANFTTRIISKFDVGTRRLKRSGGLENDVSIMVLHETLDHASRIARFGYPYRIDFGDDTFYSDLLEKHLKSKRFCPSEISLLKLTGNNTTLYLASCLERQSLSLDHENCTTSKCVARQIHAGYATRHLESCIGCEYGDVDSHKISNLLLQGKLPVVKLIRSKKDGQKIIIEVVADAPYFAISHVWSDGLGNKDSNSLPQCQLRRLWNLASALYENRPGQEPLYICIWIDTLCVPLAKINKAGHLAALKRLHEAFQSADKVLVLDSDLLQTPSWCSPEERLLRITLCGWMRRLWTLEEGVLGQRDLRFQFQDAAVKLPTSFDSVNQAIGLLTLALYEQFVPTRVSDRIVASPITVASDSDHAFFSSILTALPYRSTSVQIDETICLSHILGLDVKSLLDSKENIEDRMAKFLDLLAKSNRHLSSRLLHTEEPKLQTDGLRWAPASLLSLNPSDISHLLEGMNKDKTYFDARGLKVSNRAACILDFGTRPLKKAFLFRIGKGIWNVVVPYTGNQSIFEGLDHDWTSSSTQILRTMNPSRDWSLSWKRLYLKPPPQLALIGKSQGSINDNPIAVVALDNKHVPKQKGDNIPLHARYVGLGKSIPLYVVDPKVVVDYSDGTNAEEFLAHCDKFDIPEEDRMPISKWREKLDDAFTGIFDEEVFSVVEAEEVSPKQEWLIK
ncbi:MAG: hypothetical protein M1834_000506 [Cirrosporium novae-zelandiae]|nr:MAG: hypothetical protein M1834_000506 [Cirrosporium novae-zelandiae]